ncbi:MAG TPA: cobalt ECF transporter T component CbiQ [Candidatus Limnocylindrales bacterium]|nr:cobalt ECF transporter T component CbiQ [Candidatus Limnocylindrales bacterium]
MDLDRHIPRDSPVHQFDARLKLILAVVAIVGIALLPAGSAAAFLVAWLATIVFAVLARLGPWRLVRGSWIVLPFAIVALPLVFTRPGEPLLSVDLGPLGLTATREGLRDALSIVARSWLSVQVALLLAYATPFPDLIDALRALRLPAILVSIISFMYRYLAVIGDEAGRMNRARASRSASRRGEVGPRSGRTDSRKGRAGPLRVWSRSLAWRAHVAGGMVGSLFIRSYERSERVYAAMLARGFDGSLQGATLARPAAAQLGTFAVILGAIALFTAVTILWGPRW